MEKEALKHYLSDKYQGWESFCNTVIFPIFGKDDYEDKLIVVKVNVNFDADLAAEYKVMASPTIGP